MTTPGPRLLESSAGSAQPEAAHRLKRWLYLTGGTLLVGIAILGIFLPLLPTTPFLLLAAGCFGKSSPRAYRWLVTNRVFGAYLRNYHEHRRATLRSKVVSIASIWLGIAASAFIFGLPLWVDGVLVLVAACVTLHLVRLTTMRPPATGPTSPNDGNCGVTPTFTSSENQ